MNLHSVFEELDKLYEFVEEPAEEEEATELSTEVAGEETGLTEDANESVDEEEASEVEQNDEEEVTEQPVSVVLECSKCGGVIIKAEADVEINDEAELANMAEPCQYCEETAGYVVLGALAPYGVADEEPEIEIIEDEEIEDEAETEEVVDEALEEGIFDSKEKKAIAYNRAIKEVLDDDCSSIVSAMCTSVISMLHDAIEYTGDEAAFKAEVKKLAQNVAQAVKAKKGQRIIDRVVSFGQREASDSDALDRLSTAVNKMNELKRIPKIGAEVHAYFNDQLNAELAGELNNFIN